MLTDRFLRPVRWLDQRHHGRFLRPGLPFVNVGLALACAVSVAALGTGCDEVIEEDCFEQSGNLTQVTTDTLTVDHKYPALSPDGTRIIFLTDFYVEQVQEDDDTQKELGQGDYVIIDVPAPGEDRPPTSQLEAIGNASRIDFDERSERTLDEYGQTVEGLNAFKGELTWIDDDTIIGVMENSRFLSRLFVWDIVGKNAFNDFEVTPNGIIDADFLIEQENAVDRRFKFFYRYPQVSPSGEWVAFSRFYYDEGALLFDESDDEFEYPAIYAANLTDGRVVRVTNGSAREDQPTWSPDGNSIAFTAIGDSGQPDIFRVTFDPDNPAAERTIGQPFTDGRIRLTATGSQFRVPEYSFEPTWLRNGSIVFTSTRRAPCTPRRIRNLWIMNGDGSDQRPYVVSEEDDASPVVANYDFAAPGLDDLIVFTSRRNRDDAFAGQKEDLWVIRGGF